MPASEAADAIHLLDGSSEEARKGATQGGRGEEQGDADLQLMTEVKAGEIEDNSREKASFTETQEEATSNEAAEGVCLGLEHRDDTPCGAECG